MPSNQYDATIKLVYIADPGSNFASDTIPVGKAFDVIGSVEIGKELMENVTRQKLFVSVVNRSQAKVLATGHYDHPLAASEKPHNEELRVSIAGGWSANEGDVIEAVATYRVSTQLFTDYSTLTSLPVITV